MQRHREKLKAYGRFDTGLTAAGPVREHLAALAEYGLGITPVRNIVWGRKDPGPRRGELPRHVKRETAAAILAVKPELHNLAPGARIPARGTQRRLRALVAIGWPLSRLAAQLDMQRSNIGPLLQRDRVTVRVHRQVAALFERLWDTPPPHEEGRDKASYDRARNYARRRRWPPALAWEDIDLDPAPPSPDTAHDQVDEIAIDLATHGERVRLSVLERREAVRLLCALGLSDAEAARRLGVVPRSVARIRHGLGLHAGVGVAGRAGAA